jgi:hypothetical protein
MSLFVKTCPKLLALLEGFYRGMPGQTPSEAEMLRAEEIPEPYRRLLVHRRDMTSTLSDYHGEELRLRVIERTLTDDWLARHVVLEGGQSRRPVEYGASRTNLGILDEPVRHQILQGRVPLGGVLNQHGIEYGSCPGAFFRVPSNDLIERLFELRQTEGLFGRCNCLTDAAGQTISEVIEILPPESDTPQVM